jgi:hypothetical protein
MSSLSTRSILLRAGTASIALAGAAALALLLLRGNPVQAQGPMSAPACQCSAPTAIPGMASRVAHCLCGAMSCAIAESPDAARGNQMQCVRP